MAKNAKRKITPSLNLRTINHTGHTDLLHTIQQEVDAFIRHNQANQQRLEIIIGKGLHSKQLKDGRHPVRYIVEDYLKQCGYSFTLDAINPGVLIVYV